MDNFVAQLRHNVNLDPDTGEEKNNGRYRELLYYVSCSSPKIKIVNKCSEDGDISFEVPMGTIGITYDLLVKYKKEICSEFIANFIGELLIRENINMFAHILTGINPQAYPSIVNRFEHRKFGMDIHKDKLVFCFHISLLQDILLEDVKRKIR